MKFSLKLSRVVFRITRSLVRLFYGKAEVVEIESIPENNTIIVANHSQMNGPIVGELFLPENCYIWCAGEMMNRKEVPEYAFNDFWSHKPKHVQPFYRILSHIIAPLAECLFTNARTIAVYHDACIIGTFRETVDMLKNGRNILIFPEKAETHNNILNKLQENFVDVARLYYKRTGVELTFVPMYVAPELRKMYIGKGVKYMGEKDISDERIRITDYISGEITKIACSLPKHTVVPYNNIPKKQYITNLDTDKIPQYM